MLQGPGATGTASTVILMSATASGSAKKKRKEKQAWANWPSAPEILQLSNYANGHLCSTAIEIKE